MYAYLLAWELQNNIVDYSVLYDKASAVEDMYKFAEKLSLFLHTL